MFPSAISRYLVSNKERLQATPPRFQVSIRYIAVLGFQHEHKKGSQARRDVSIRYIAVLGFQQQMLQSDYVERLSFHPLYRGTWFPTDYEGITASCDKSFHPLYRGTWFPT